MNHNMAKLIIISFLVISPTAALDALNNSSSASNISNSQMSLNNPSISPTNSGPSCNCTELISNKEACKEANKVMLKNIANGISLGAIFYHTETDLTNFQNQSDVSIRRLTYEIALDNWGDPRIDNMTLTAELCDGLKYESSTLKGSANGIFDPTVIQDEKKHTTSTLRWSLEPISSGEKRVILLNTLYISNNPIEPMKTKFNLSGTAWGYQFSKLNDKIYDISVSE